MNILEFIASLEAMPRQIHWHARDKIMLAQAFGLENPPPSVPYDVIGTRIPNRAIDGFMAQKILSDPSIEKDAFAHYAFTAAAIFAAQQVAIRSGITTRLLRTEYPVFVYRNLDATAVRIAAALDYVPMLVQWWQQKKETFEDAGVILRLLNLFKSRVMSLTPWGIEIVKHVEQAFLIVSYDGDKDANPTRAMMLPHDQAKIEGKVGLLVMPQYGDAQDYKKVFDYMKPHLSYQAVVLIYDKRPIVDECCGLLVAAHPWRGMALKHLAYQKEVLPDDYALLALQANFFFDMGG